MDSDDLRALAFGWSEELRKAINDGDRDEAAAVFVAAGQSVPSPELVAITSVLLGELVQAAAQADIVAGSRQRRLAVGSLVDDFVVNGRTENFFSEVMKFVVESDADVLANVAIELIDTAIGAMRGAGDATAGGDTARQGMAEPGAPDATARRTHPPSAQPMTNQPRNDGERVKDLSGEFWFAGDSVYVRALRSYGGDALPAEADAIARYGADAMCSIAYGIRSSMFEWRKGGKLLPGVGGFGPESIDELTAIAVSVAIPALVDWTDNPMLCVGAAGDYYTRRLRSVLPGAERVVDAIGRANVLDLATVFAEAAALTVAVAARHRVKLRVSEREIATTEMPKAVIVTRMTMEEPVLGGIGLAEMLKPLIRPDLGGTPANAAGVSTGHQFPLGMSQRAYERLTRFAFKSDDPAQQAGEIDARISDDGFDMKWHDMTVAQITAAILGRSAGRDWSDEAILRLAGAFVAGARLGEVAFGVTLPLGEPFASGDVVTQAHDLLPDSAEEALEFLQSHLPQPMQLWLVTASLRGIRDGLAPISADEASYPTLAAALAGMRWVAQAV